MEISVAFVDMLAGVRRGTMLDASQATSFGIPYEGCLDVECVSAVSACVG